MPDGSCFCGKVRISYEGEPKMAALCHCTDCRKISGSTYSTNIGVAQEGFKVSGNPKSISKTTDGGKNIVSYFCGDCGSTLYRDSEGMPGVIIIKAGVLDDYDALSTIAKPGVELYTKHRVAWVPQTEGTAEKQAMS